MTTLTNRTFGIEAKGLDHMTVEAVLSAEGISVYRTNYMNHTAETTKWKVKPDGSLSGLSFEVVSPNEEGIEQVRTVLKALGQWLGSRVRCPYRGCRELGSSSSRTCTSSMK